MNQTVSTQEKSCVVCGKTPSMNHPELDQELCISCAKKQHVFNGANEHLKALLEPMVIEWAKHWFGEGMPVKGLIDIAEAFPIYDGGVEELLQNAFG